MSNYTIQNKAGEHHVWTHTGNWVAWFRTEAQAKDFVLKADGYEHEPFLSPSYTAHTARTRTHTVGVDADGNPII